MNQESQPQIPNALWLAWGTVLFWTGFFHDQLLWGVLWAWGVSFIILNIVNPRMHRSRRRESLIWALLAGLCFTTWSDIDFQKLLREENLDGISTRVLHKAALQDYPAIFPRVVVEGMPQDFYVYVPGSEELTLTIGSSTQETHHMGHGLFKVRSSGNYANVKGETATVHLTTEHDTIQRELKFSKALPHPNITCKGQGSRAYVLSEDTDEIFVVQPDGILQTLKTGNGPSGCVVVNNRLLVTHIYEPNLWVFDAATFKALDKISLDAPQKSIAKSRDSEAIAVALQGPNPSMALLSPNNLKQVEHIALPLTPEWIAPGPNSNHWTVSSRESPALMSLKRTEKPWTTTVHPLSRPLLSMIADATGNHIFATTTGYKPDGQPLKGNHFIQDQILKLDSLSLQLQARMITHRRAETPKAEGDFLKWTAGAGPSSLSLMKNGDLLVAFSGTTQWWQVKPDLSGPVHELSIQRAGLTAPHSAIQLNDDTFVLSSPSEGTIALFHLGNQTTELYQMGLGDDELETHYPMARQRREGEKAFYEATRSGRSCQSCHFHGDSDHSVHNIGDLELMPATLSVRGIAGTSPYLRGGVYNRVRELLHVPEEFFGGYFITDPMRESNIEHYVESLGRPANSVTQTTASRLARESRGLEAFIKAQCTSCHSFPAFTDLSQHPATRIFPSFPDPALELDTPSLIGLKTTAPYLFDGRAQKVSEVFQNDADKHGQMANLNDQEKADLYFFLESL